jgi:hypothetical protein
LSFRYAVLLSTAVERYRLPDVSSGNPCPDDAAQKCGRKRHHEPEGNVHVFQPATARRLAVAAIKGPAHRDAKSRAENAADDGSDQDMALWSFSAGGEFETRD